MNETKFASDLKQEMSLKNTDVVILRQITFQWCNSIPFRSDKRLHKCASKYGSSGPLNKHGHTSYNRKLLSKSHRIQLHRKMYDHALPKGCGGGGEI